MATTKQIAFVEKLVAERADIYRAAGQDACAVAITDWFATVDLDTLLPTTKAASAKIDALIVNNKNLRTQLRTVAPAAATSTEKVTDGMYRMDGVIYKVQYAKNGSGNLYAKELVIHGEAPDTYGEFVYAPGVIRNLRPEHKLTLEEAKEFGALYGTCCVCARTLTDEKSIAAGIGPVCAKKF